MEYLRQSFSSLMNETTWMLPEDLKVAQEKLAAIDPFVAYPDWIMDDAELTQGYEGVSKKIYQQFSGNVIKFLV